MGRLYMTSNRQDLGMNLLKALFIPSVKLYSGLLAHNGPLIEASHM